MLITTKKKEQTMNTENTTGAVETTAVNTPKQRGRKRNPAVTRRIYLAADNTPRKQGAPKPGTVVRFVEVQASTKTSEFVFNDSMTVQEETVKARVYKPKANVTVNPAPTATAENPMPNMDEVKSVEPVSA